ATIGYLLIPVFQFYWIFQATVGVARELNCYAERRRLRAPRASVLLGVAVSIYFLFAVIPFLGFLASLLNLLVFPLFMHSIYRTAICFCADKRIVEEDTAKTDHAKLEQDWLPSGVFGVILVPFGLMLCLFGCLFTPLRQPQAEAIAIAL